MINTSKISSFRILIESSLLFLCFLDEGEHHGVLSFSSPRFLLSSSPMQRNSLRYVQSFRFHHCRRHPRAILRPEIASSFHRCGDSMNDDDEQRAAMRFFNISATLPLNEYKDGANNRWIVPQHKRRPLHDAFDSDLDVAVSTVGTVTSMNKVDDADHIGALGLVVWMVSLCAFVFVNKFVGPWPKSVFYAVPDRIWLLAHQLGGMLFGGGVILTTCVEWLVGQSKNVEVLRFWFHKVPLLDTSIVLPGLTLSILSGMGLTTVRYGGLSNAPPHVIYTFLTLVVFAAWWGFTDLTTQGGALEAVLEVELGQQQEKQKDAFDNSTTGSTTNISVGNDNNNGIIRAPTSPSPSQSVLKEVPKAVNERLLSNVVSCLLVCLLYAIMVLKLGTVKF